MDQEIRAKFLPRFLDAARMRIARARRAMVEGDGSTVTHELHALGGEASALELTPIADLARRAAEEAYTWSESDADSDAAKCRASIGELDTAIGTLRPN